MIEIDGAQGEGGGQVVRTALALAALTGTDLHLYNVRAQRRRPGLAPQHLTVVRALAAICEAEIEGDRLRATELQFEPQSRPQAGTYTFDVSEAAENGSAGSVPLLLQALLVPLAWAGAPSTLTLRGGTHVAWSPSFHYLRDVFAPAVRAMGLEVTCRLGAYGFYPAGGGVLHAQIEPVQGDGDTLHRLRPMAATERGALERVRGAAVVTNLPDHIPRRMVQQCTKRLEALGCPVEVEPVVEEGAGPGAGIFLVAEYGQIRAGFSALGAPGKPSEAVADEACDALWAHHRTEGAIDPHLADQLLAPMALARGPSHFTTSAVTSHLRTQAALIRHFLPVEVHIEADTEDGPGRVEVVPSPVGER